MKLKMYEIFGKIYLKVIRRMFSQYVLCNQGRDGVCHEEKEKNSIFWWWRGVTSTRKVRFKILSMNGEKPTQFVP